MPLTEQERADRAEVKAFHAGVNRSDGPKNRKSQLLLVLALAATFVGASLALAAGGRPRVIGLCLLAVGFPALVVTAVWCFRNWDY
jgi:fatty acid desaturase